jgi:predicted acyltransferase
MKGTIGFAFFRTRRRRRNLRHRQSPGTPRRLAVDVLRGLCLWGMFLQDGLLGTFNRISPSSSWATVLRQFAHAEWNGFHLADANLPAFFALIGTSMLLSYHNHRIRGTTKRAYALKVAKRFLFMLAAAVYFKYWGDLPFFFELASCILLSGLLMLTLPLRALIVTLVFVLLSQWAVMAWLPVPGHGAGDFSREGNAAAYVQTSIASALSAVIGLSPQNFWIGAQIAHNLVFPTGMATCIAGLVLGYILLSDLSYQRQALLIAALGIVAMTLGLFWDRWCPINKHIWTPSYALFSAGFASVFLAGFIQICEVWNCRRFASVFSCVGRSPLVAVFVFTAVPLNDVAEQLADIVMPSTMTAEPLVVAVIQLALAAPCFAIARRWLVGDAMRDFVSRLHSFSAQSDRRLAVPAPAAAPAAYE